MSALTLTVDIAASDGMLWGERLDAYALNLSDATGRAHAAWWLFGKCDVGNWPDLHTGARLWLDPNVYNESNKYNRRKLWAALLNAGRVWDWLHHLDTEDPRLLEDGSRWVDAEALRLVVLHVSGRSS